MTDIGAGADFDAMLPLPRRVPHIVVVLALAAGACDRAPRPENGDSALVPVPTDSVDSTIVAPALNGWTLEAGPALLVSSDPPQLASAVFPQASGALSDTLRFDESALVGARVDLFSRTGLAGQGTVAGSFEPASSECIAWPRVRIIPDERVAPGDVWTVALLADRASALAADSVGALSRADSARYTRAVLQLASMIRSDPTQPFHGLPFAVRTILRFRPEPGVEALVSDVVRRISTEANPREEHTLIVAERDSSEDRFELVYHERTAGAEDTVIASDALAMLAVGPNRRPTLVLSRDDGSGTIYALLERVARARWRVRWSSAYAGC